MSETKSHKQRGTWRENTVGLGYKNENEKKTSFLRKRIFET